MGLYNGIKERLRAQEEPSKWIRAKEMEQDEELDEACIVFLFYLVLAAASGPPPPDFSI